MSLIEEEPHKQIRMAHLATVGSSKVNGVAVLQSRLLRDKVLTDFSNFYPDKFTNVTNGVTPRRFIKIANPRLAELITRHLGDGWLNDLDQLRQLEPLADDAKFRAEWRAIKQQNKETLAALLQQRASVKVDSAALFDVMVKRLHEYKRQLLKMLHVLTLYNRLIENPQRDFVPRVVIFGAKAAPGYRMAKLVIKLINSVADVINHDTTVAGRLKIVFPANYNVTLAERIIPAADISEQISLAGKEASGTGNMKLALNGAVTTGTLDGANVEIRDLVGAENFFLFGLTEEQVSETWTKGYTPKYYYDRNPALRQVLDQINVGTFAPKQPELFHPLIDNLLQDDAYRLLADYQAYIDCQDQAEAAYRDTDHWTRMSILNCARCGFFSSDRSIREYAENIWGVKPVEVE
jgi:starch phosphorylase